MPNKIVTLGLVFSLSMFAGSASGKELVDAPKGWIVKHQGEIRVATNGNAIVTVQPWLFLQDVGAKQWLTSIASKTKPIEGVVTSSKDVVPEKKIPGGFSISRKARYSDQNGSSLLLLCPGKEGHARLLTLDVKDGGLSDSTWGWLYIQKVCKNEPKGSGSTDGNVRHGFIGYSKKKSNKIDAIYINGKRYWDR